MPYRSTFVLLVFLGLSGTAALGQNINFEPTSVNAAGTVQQAGNLQLSWSVGQVVFQTRGNASITLTEGFQQPKVLLSSTPEPTPPTLQQGLTLYPNPTYGELTLEATFTGPGNTRLSIVDMAGRLVRNLEPLETPTPEFRLELNVDDLSAGLYVLRVQHQPHGSATEPLRHIRFQVQR